MRSLLVLATVIALSVTVRPAGLRAQPPRPEADQELPPGAGRRQLEQRFRQRMGELVRRRLQLTGDQMTRLQSANVKFERQRSAIASDEREIRRALRQQMLAGDGANQPRVAELLDQTLRIQRRRLDLAESEQRELANFLTPVQRAKYFGLQNELRKRMQELREPGGQRPPNRRPPPRPMRP